MKNKSIQPKSSFPPVKVAVLIDGGFFVKRFNSVFNQKKTMTGTDVANRLYTIAHRHVGKENTLYRIFYYDCHPFDKKMHNPIDNKVVDFKLTVEYKFRNELMEALKKKRKVALRLGTLKESKTWGIYPHRVKELLSGKIEIKDLKPEDVYVELKQKGIDMKIGVDIASLALKRFVDRIVLISGDSDFVPAAKLARREGIDFILDPMGAEVEPTLFEHIDGLESSVKKIRPKTSPSSPAGGKKVRQQKKLGSRGDRRLTIHSRSYSVSIGKNQQALEEIASSSACFIYVIWNAHSIWNNHCNVKGYDVMYFTSGIMAISLLAYSCMIFLKRERGLDFSKMKWFIREVVKNRVCYSVMDVCYKLQKETKVFYDRLSKVSKKGLMLSDKLEEIQKVAMGRNNIAAMKAIVNKNKEVMDRINVMMDNVHEIVDLVQKRLNELKAKGGCRKD